MKKGSKLTIEHKKKLSIAHKGKRLTEEHKRNITKSRIGEKNPNWKGGRQRERHNGCLDYTLWRTGVFKRDNWICQTCGKRSSAGNPIYLQAHHISGWTQYPEERYNIDNGITLCIDCHKLTDNYGNKK